MDVAREKEIVQMYKGGIKVGAISDEMQLSATAVRRILKKHGIDLDYSQTGVDEDAVIERYLTNEPIPNILKDHKITYGKLYGILSRHGVPTRKALNNPGHEMALERAIEMYKEGHYLWQIAEETGVAQPTLHRELHRRKIPLRRQFTRRVESGDS